MPNRVLIITDRLHSGPALESAIRERVTTGGGADGVSFRLLVTNPARAEFHLRHPERHDAVAAAQPQLHQLLQDLAMVAGSTVSGEISIRHDPFEAVEEDLLVQPADEVLIAVHEHELRRRLHQDLPHRLRHLNLPMTVVSDTLVEA